MWYIITPWKKKCLGKELPKQVVKHATRYINKNIPMSRDVYFLKHAIVIRLEDEDETI